jgi:hypothetical protein
MSFGAEFGSTMPAAERQRVPSLRRLRRERGRAGVAARVLLPDTCENHG